MLKKSGQNLFSKLLTALVARRCGKVAVMIQLS